MEIPEQFFTVYQETWLFLGSCLLGLPLGILWDAMRLLRCLLPHHAVAVFLEDVLLVFAAAVAVQCYAIVFARSALRYYDALGCVCGFVIYCCTVGAVTGRILHRIRHGRTALAHQMKHMCCLIWKKIAGVFVRCPEKRRKRCKMSKNA
ncbi:MAG: spore cortex biosynthesis protein YabQ [Oscillospiraceae bacterium]|nr:spore cortex biosynthesis protein YabQ [Oscillospiraceae bacterium]